MVLFFVLIAFVYNFKHRMDDIAFTCAFVFLIALLLGWLRLWSWKSRQFLCSTAWAKKQGLTPDRLRMFSFGGAESQHSGTARAKSDGPPRFSRAAKKPASGSGGSNVVPPGQTVHSGGAWKIVTVIVAAVMLLLAIPVGFLLLTYENLRVVRNQSISDCVVHGIVTDAVTGNPIPGARVDDNHYGSGPNRTPQQAWTDANGHYELKTWPEEHSIAASAPGYESKLATLKTTLFGRERIARMDFQLRPTHAAEAPQFGPVIEEVLKAPDRRVAELLDLDTGQRATSTNFGENDRETHAWIREHELDVLGVVEKGQIAVLCMDMAVAPTTSNRWDAITPSEGVTNWGLNQQEPKPITGISPVTNNTDTWFFRTREGGMGILQIVGSTDNPRGVKIRYKLVQNGKQNTSTTSAAEQNANQEIARLKLQHAEQEVKEAEAKVSIGLMAEFDLQKAKWSRDIAAAEIKGDNVEVARLKLAIAESDLDVAGKMFSVGKATSQEYEQAKLARDTEMVRYKLAQGATNRLPVTLFEPAVTPEQLAEPPKLRFLAWQDEWKTNQPGAARHPDGSTVTNVQELGWLRQVYPGGCDVSALRLVPAPRFLHLWFSHPLFGQTSLNEVTLLNDSGEPIALGANGSMAGGAQDASEPNGNLGWLTYTLSPGEGTNIPARVTVRLRYTIGPLERTQEVATDYHGSMSLEGNSQLNGVGQNSEGKAFVAIAVDAEKMKSRQFGVFAATKDGREVEPAGSERGGNIGSGVRVENFEFAAPLADIARFRIGTRPIRTVEWKDVVLPEN
jgi:hypothetical protein